MIHMRRAVFALTLCVGLVALAERPNTTQITANTIKSFGFDLLDSLYSDESISEPIAISPLSIAEALILTTNGAEKETREELENLFLTKKLRDEKINLAALNAGLLNLRKQLKEAAERSAGYFEFRAANSLWGNKNRNVGFKFSEQFLTLGKNSFGAKLNELDFANRLAVPTINKWVGEKTSGKITELIKKLRPDDVAVILNAIYAKGRFQHHFNYLTEGTYVDSKGKERTVSYMTKTESKMGYYSDETLKAFSFKVEKTPKRGEKILANQIALDILVPKSGNVGKLVKALDAKKYDTIVGGLKAANIELKMPPGTISQKEALKLKPALKEEPFSLDFPFDSAKAQFKPLGKVSRGNKDLHISDILTKTFYEVTPFGFEAAAATAVLISRESTTIDEPKLQKHEIKGDSIQIIRHIPTGLPLFVTVFDQPARYTEAQIVKHIKDGKKHQRFLTAKRDDGVLRYGIKDKKEVLGVWNDEKYVRAPKLK